MNVSGDNVAVATLEIRVMVAGFHVGGSVTNRATIVERSHHLSPTDTAAALAQARSSVAE
jgi:hypothetical protein